MRPRSLILAAAIAALAVTGCGGSSGSDEKDIKTTVKGVYVALGDKDAKKVCSLISKKGRERIETAAARGSKKQSCEQVFRLILTFSGDSLKRAKDVKVSNVKIDGDKGKATVSLNDRKSDLSVVKEDGDWKLSGLDLAGGSG